MPRAMGVRRGPKSVPLDASLRERLKSYVEGSRKQFEAAIDLGLSHRTLTRLLDGSDRLIAWKTYQLLLTKLGGSSPLLESAVPVETSRITSMIGEAMLADSRGDHLAAAAILAKVPSNRTPIIDAGYRLVAARNALARDHLEIAQDYLAGMLPFLRREGGQQLAFARVACELALVYARRNKVADALLTFEQAESTLVTSGVHGLPYLVFVRQAFLGYVLRIGRVDMAKRLLEADRELASEWEGKNSLLVHLDSWLLDGLHAQASP